MSSQLITLLLKKMSAEKLHRALVSEPIIVRAQPKKKSNFWEVGKLTGFKEQRKSFRNE